MTRNITQDTAIQSCSGMSEIYPFQPSAAFYIEASRLICIANHDWSLYEMHHSAEMGQTIFPFKYQFKTIINNHDKTLPHLLEFSGQ